MKFSFKKIYTLVFSAIFFLALVQVALAATPDTLGVQFGTGTGLGQSDPTVVVANIIRIALGFLGLVAVAIIIYGGFLWMTASGNEEKITKARKLLISAGIGLVIILSAFGIASYIISNLTGATGGSTNDNGSCVSSGGSCQLGETCCQGSSCQQGVCSSTGIGGTGDSFKIMSTSPAKDQTNIPKNSQITISFNKAINATLSATTLSNYIKVEKTASISPTTGVETASTLQTIPGAISIISGGRGLMFSANGNLPDWSKIRLQISNESNILSEANQPLICNGLCDISFSTNDIVDNEPPSINLIQSQICANDGHLLATANTVTATARDNFGLNRIEFYQATGTSPYLYVDTVAADALNYKEATHQYVTTAFNVGATYSFMAKAYDLASWSATSSFQTTIKAGHCCNGIEDTSLNEKGVDCGGDCAACVGGPCGTDSDCVSGYCDAGFCKASPVITSISPAGGFCKNNHNKSCLANSECTTGVGDSCDQDTPNGKALGLVSIIGQGFGETMGQVFFSSSNTSGWVLANFPDACGDNWHDNQITVLVPALAATGPIKIKLASTSINGTVIEAASNSNGSNIPDFVVNNINRPGLCTLSPDNGIMKDSLSYSGINLLGARAYFGAVEQKIAAIGSPFNNTTSGTAQVPNLQAGRTTTFVISSVGTSSVASNYVAFTKNPEPYIGPMVVSFEPSRGSKGQYITIKGSGFGSSKGNSDVKFVQGAASTSANYDFPQVCAQSVWSDKQIIVKVPDGLINGSNYSIVVKKDGYNAANNKTFAFDTTAVLTPSLCKIDPVMGQVGTAVKLWGENFGNRNASSAVRFFINKPGTINSWNNQTTVGQPDVVETAVSSGSVTGPVQLISGNLISNGLNFKVGACSDNSQCDGGVCCPVTSNSVGTCRASEDECFTSAPACVYEWQFSTSNSCGSDKDCAGGSVCNLLTNTCGPDAGDSSSFCSGTNTNQCNNTQFCPNAPGLCGISTTTSIGANSCGSDYCNTNFSQCNNQCVFDNVKNKCATNIMCNVYEGSSGTAFGMSADNLVKYPPVCQKIGTSTSGFWITNVGSGSCGLLGSNSNWNKIDGGRCVLAGVSCNVCSSGFQCTAFGDANDNQGKCVIGGDICPSGTNCVGSSCTYPSPGVNSCDCCCRVAQQAQDCCTGTCGPGLCGANSQDYGLCTGCTTKLNNVTSTIASDAKCQCAGHAGQVCDTSGAGGIGTCVDLNPNNCQLHPENCCINAASSTPSSPAIINSKGVQLLLASNSDPKYYCPYDCHGIVANPVANGNYSTSTPANCSPVNVISTSSVCSESCDLTNPNKVAACLCQNTLNTVNSINTNNNTTTKLLSCAPANEANSGVGLCCGCTSDNECGSGSLGCMPSAGHDYRCCESRPRMVGFSPTGSSTCANVKIKVAFDKYMNVTASADKIVLLGEQDDTTCADGVAPIAVIDNSWSAKIARAVQQIFKPILALWGVDNTWAYGTHYYCPVAGTVTGYNLPAGAGVNGTVLEFNPNYILNADKNYYVVVKGDNNFDNTTQEGVVSDRGVAMLGNNQSFVSQVATSTYQGKVWSFKVRPDENGNKGICVANNIKITPSSYLFQTTINDSADDDHDNNPYNEPDSSYDTKRDRDKVFMAELVASNDNVLASSSLYSWDWDWNSTNLKVATTTPTYNVFGDKTLVVAAPVTDGDTYIRAAAHITDRISRAANNAVVSSVISESSHVYVFECKNPNPPVKDDGTWEPETSDNLCDPSTGTVIGQCVNLNFDFAYCRDSGGVGTATDLPALKKAFIDTPLSTTTLSQAVFTNAFFDAPASSTLTIRPSGSSLSLNWTPVPSAISYSIYYGTTPGEYQYVINTSSRPLVINDLNNGQSYYFAVTAHSQSGAESAYSKEIKAIPQDNYHPQPIVIQKIATSSSALWLSWAQSTSTDVVKYRVYYGTSQNYNSSKEIKPGKLNLLSAVVTISSNGTYYFAVSAVDSSGNESPYRPGDAGYSSASATTTAFNGYIN